MQKIKTSPGENMEIGYACLTQGVCDTKIRTCRKSNASDEILKEIIKYNLQSLDNMLDYNISNDIKLLRISSDIMPFASHSINKLKWWELFEDKFYLIGKKAKENNIRLSMHPGQYTVINSQRSEVVENSVKDLIYHTCFLDSLCVDYNNKIILHIGGAYGNKAESAKRFVENYNKLNENIKKRLVIENDDKIYNIGEVLSIGVENNIPVVYDNLHNKVNPFDKNEDIYWIKQASQTWKGEDKPQKTHYSQQAEGKKAGSHSDTINVCEFLIYAEKIKKAGIEIDIMLEVKDKNLSALKCVNALKNKPKREIEKEWARYKYLILEHSPQIYMQIRELLKNNNKYLWSDFYELIDTAKSQEVKPNHAVNAAQHVWGYFKKTSDIKTKEKFEKEIIKIANAKSTIALKKILCKMAKEKNQNYLLNSLYFEDVL